MVPIFLNNRFFDVVPYMNNMRFYLARFLCVWMTTMNPRRFVLSSDGSRIRRGNSFKKMKKNSKHGSVTSLPFAGKLHFQKQHKINNCEKYPVINYLFLENSRLFGLECKTTFLLYIQSSFLWK